MKTLKTAIIVLLATSVSILSVTAATIIKPDGVSLTGADAFFAADNIINGSGLETPLNTGDVLPPSSFHTFGVGVASDNWVTGAPGGFPSDWFAASGTIPTFVFDLGQDRQLSTFHFWQYGSGSGVPEAVQGNGAKSVELRFNTHADGSVSFPGAVLSFDLDHAAPDGGPTGFTMPRQDFDLGGLIDARYVEMRVTDSWFVAPGDGTGLDEHGHPIRGGDRVGIGEVRFSLVPEPGTMALMLCSLLVLRLHPFRRR